MKPIDKFIDTDVQINIFDNEIDLTEYVWKMAMFLMSYTDEDTGFDSSDAVPIFKQRYNDRQINMPWTYEEYLKNKDIQATIAGLGYDVDKFWFALLFIYDYCQGDCFNAQEYDTNPYSELLHFSEIVNENLINDKNPFEEHIEFEQEIKLEIKVGKKVVHTIKLPNTIKYLADCSHKCCEQLMDMVNRDEYNPMHHIKIKEERVFESQNYQIFLFTRLFTRLFSFHGMPQKNIRSRNNEVSYNKQFLISRLIYLTKISENEEFYYEPSTLKGYMSRYKNQGTKGRINRFYKGE